MTGGNPTVIPGTDSELVGADALIGPMGNVLKPEWVDVLNRPLRILTKVFYAGKYSLPSSVTAVRSTTPKGRLWGTDCDRGHPIAEKRTGAGAPKGSLV